MESHVKAMETVVVELTAQLSQLSAQLKLLTAQGQPAAPKSSPWLPLKEAAPLLHFSSPRALKNRILRGSFPPDCFRQVPSPSGMRHSYLGLAEKPRPAALQLIPAGIS
jgi:hypothetical protein